MSDAFTAPLLQLQARERCAASACASNSSEPTMHHCTGELALFYHHVAGTNAFLSDRIDEVTEQGKAWDDQAAVALFLRYLLPCNDAETSGLQDELSNAVSFVASSATDFADAAASHADALQQQGSVLATCKSTDQAQRIAASLLHEARELHAVAVAKEQDRATRRNRSAAAELVNVRQQALTDALTELANRNIFDKEISRLVQEKQEFDFDFSLIMMDIDHFKRINDDYGLIGDKVLKQLANQTAASARRSDIAARYGGEEFAILLPDTPVDQASGSPRTSAKHQPAEHAPFRHRRDRTDTASFSVAQYAHESEPDLHAPIRPCLA